MFKLKITARAEKQLKQIFKQYQRKAINEALLEIKETPLIGKLLGRELSKRYSYRVGTYRIIYIVDVEDKIITIISAGHRGVVYRKK